MLTILAVDPGSRNTGLVVRRGDELLAWKLTVRQDNGRLPDGRYLTQVRQACAAALAAAGIDPADRDAYVVGVEGLADWPERDPKRRRNQTHLYGTAIVLGGLLMRWPDAVTVASGRGVANLHATAYPAAIRPPINGKGKDRLRDVRAAWDHSHAAETAHNRQRRSQR